MQLANRAGIPPGVINVVTTHANIADVGRELCENPTVKKVSFTGSTPVAKMLYKYAAGTMKKYASSQWRVGARSQIQSGCPLKLEEMLLSSCSMMLTSMPQ